MNIDTIKFAFSQRHTLFGMLGAKGFLNWMPDAMYLKMLFKLRFGYALDLNDPKSFSEKIQWLKLYDRKPSRTKLVDKYEVRNYIKETLGEEYLIPLIGGPWADVDEIDFDALPERFVLKPTHDSGSVVICKNKATFDIEQAKNKLAKSLKRVYYTAGREWPYKNVKPRIIAEKYMEDSNCDELTDYKLFCFNGKVMCSYIGSSRFSEKGLHLTYYDRDWNKLPFTRGYPAEELPFPKPKCYDKMLELAELLARDIPFVRIDFYEIEGHLYFGECTFYPGSGMRVFDPPEWDNILGSWLELPKEKIK